MRVLFISPSHPPEMVSFARALAEVGATVVGVVDAPPVSAVKSYISEFVSVPSLLDDETAYAVIIHWLRRNPVSRILSNWEPTMLLAARLRAAVGLPGTSVDTTLGFRDKSLMRARVAAAGIRIPKSVRVETKSQLWTAVEDVGFPLVVKPVAGAGSSNTHYLDSVGTLLSVMPMLEGVTLSVEEFIEGEERTYETLCVNGSIKFESMSTYEPSCLTARKDESISPIIQTFRDFSSPELQNGRRLGQSVLSALGMGTGYTHMEWFLTPDNDVVFGEVACRSPGANMVDLINYTGDIDTYIGWAMANLFGRVPHFAPNPYSAAIIFKRAIGTGRIKNITGVDNLLQRYADHVARVDLLPLGAPRRDWQQTFLSDGNIVVRSPDFDATRAIADEVARAVKLIAG